MSEGFTIEGVCYPTFYIKEFDKAVALYTAVLDPPQTEYGQFKGWRLGREGDG